MPVTTATQVGSCGPSSRLPAFHPLSFLTARHILFLAKEAMDATIELRKDPYDSYDQRTKQDVLAGVRNILESTCAGCTLGVNGVTFLGNTPFGVSISASARFVTP